MDKAEFTGLLTQALGHLAAHSLDGSLHFICMDWRHIGELLTAGKRSYTELKNLCGRFSNLLTRFQRTK